MTYDALVFDNDGVLTTPTEYDALCRAVVDAFVAVGVSDPDRDHVHTLLGPTRPKLEAIASTYGLRPSELWDARERAAIRVQREEIRAGRKRLYDDVSSLDGLDLPRAIVSNNQHETVGFIVDHFGLDGFDPWYGREPTVKGIERKKPTPYYLERALDDMGCENPLYVGDSNVDVAAAKAAGIDSAFVHRPHRADYLLERQPTHELSSLADLGGLVG